MKPRNVVELDEAWNHEHGGSPQEARDDKDGDTEMNPEQSQDAAIANRKKAPMRRRRPNLGALVSTDPMDVHGR